MTQAEVINNLESGKVLLSIRLILILCSNAAGGGGVSESFKILIKIDFLLTKYQACCVNLFFANTR